MSDMDPFGAKNVPSLIRRTFRYLIRRTPLNKAYPLQNNTNSENKGGKVVRAHIRVVIDLTGFLGPDVLILT